MSDKTQTLLDTLTELSGILYARPEERCTRGILRVHNQTFLHAIVCEEVIGKPQILSEKTFYWWYLHSLVVHAPIQHCIICCRSTNTEQQERHFNSLLSISTSTSSRRPGEITPGIIRMQAEVKAENNQRDTLKEQQSRLGTQHTACLPHRTPLSHTEWSLSINMPTKHTWKKSQTSSSAVKELEGGMFWVALNFLMSVQQLKLNQELTLSHLYTIFATTHWSQKPYTC